MRVTAIVDSYAGPMDRPNLRHVSSSSRIGVDCSSKYTAAVMRSVFENLFRDVEES